MKENQGMSLFLHIMMTLLPLLVHVKAIGEIEEVTRFGDCVELKI